MCRNAAAEHARPIFARPIFAENEEKCTIDRRVVQQFEDTGLFVKVKRTMVQCERKEWWDIVSCQQGSRRRASSDCRVSYKPAARGRTHSTGSSASSASAASAPADVVDDAPQAEEEPQERTTLMLKNIPSGYLRQEVCELLDSVGLAGQYDFVHVPVDCFSGAGLGYGFINMTDGAAGARAYEALQGFNKWTARSRKVLAACWSEEQGLGPLIERYRNSRMMHHSVPEAYKPLLLAEGKPVAFPPATKRILKPRCMPAQGGKKTPKDQPSPASSR